MKRLMKVSGLARGTTPSIKRLLTLVLVLGLITGAVATAEAKKKPKRTSRTVEGSYDSPVLGIYARCGEPGVGCTSFSAGSNERFVTAKVQDAHSLPVYVLVRSAASGAFGEGTETFGEFCGETTEPIAIPPGGKLEFMVGAAASVYLYSCEPGVATSGTITATFSNLP